MRRSAHKNRNALRRTPSGDRKADGSLRNTWFALGLIALAAILAYQNSFSGAFVYDDTPWIVENPSIRQLRPFLHVLFPPKDDSIGGRPVVSLTLAINYAFGETNVWGYHAVNLAIHILAAWTLFGVVRRTLEGSESARLAAAGTPTTLLAAAVALLWMLHPLQTESVTYVIQRTEALMGLFYLLVLYCVIRGATSSKPLLWYVAATLSCALGMATKEVTATAPAIVLLYDRTFLAGSFREAWRRRYGLYLALAATWCIVAALLISTDFYRGTTGFAVEKFTAWTYLMTQSAVLVHYLQLAFWPTGLCLDYGWPAAHSLSEVLLPGLIVVSLLVATVWALVKRPAWGFLGAWFFVILAPTSSIVPIKDAAYEHRMYLSLAALAAGVVVGGYLTGKQLIQRRTLSPGVAGTIAVSLTALVIIVFGILTHRRNADYASEYSIWRDTVAKAPHNGRARNNFGMALAERKQYAEAIAEYQKALDIKSDFADVHNNLGAALDASGRRDEAMAHFQQALGIKPDFAEVYNNLGTALDESGQYDEALANYRKAVECKPNFTSAYYNIGNTLFRQGKMAEATEYFQKALELKPNHADAHNNLGAALATLGRTDEAIDHYRKAIQLMPRYAEAYNNLGRAMTDLGKIDQAVACFQKALEIQPQYAVARKNLQAALKLQEQMQNEPAAPHDSPLYSH
jgi:protein O-mannosyl-transferase